MASSRVAVRLGLLLLLSCSRCSCCFMSPSCPALPTRLSSAGDLWCVGTPVPFCSSSLWPWCGFLSQVPAPHSQLLPGILSRLRHSLLSLSRVPLHLLVVTSSHCQPPPLPQRSLLWSVSLCDLAVWLLSQCLKLPVVLDPCHNPGCPQAPVFFPCLLPQCLWPLWCLH